MHLELNFRTVRIPKPFINQSLMDEHSIPAGYYWIVEQTNDEIALIPVNISCFDLDAFYAIVSADLLLDQVVAGKWTTSSRVIPPAITAH